MRLDLAETPNKDHYSSMACHRPTQQPHPPTPARRATAPARNDIGALESGSQTARVQNFRGPSIPPTPLGTFRSPISLLCSNPHLSLGRVLNEPNRRGDCELEDDCKGSSNAGSSCGR